jgi:hypothetical protein
MSKVYKLREWLTLGDAARYLSAALGEDLSKADVIRLALDGYLHLSVNVLSPIPARKGSLVLASDRAGPGNSDSEISDSLASPTAA